MVDPLHSVCNARCPGCGRLAGVDVGVWVHDDVELVGGVIQCMVHPFASVETMLERLLGLWESPGRTYWFLCVDGEAVFSKLKKLFNKSTHF